MKTYVLNKDVSIVKDHHTKCINKIFCVIKSFESLYVEHLNLMNL